jgi:TolB-like protein
VLVGAALLLLAALGVTRYLGGHRGTAPPDGPDVPASIAVLPLATQSDNPEDEYLGDGLSREIIDRLAQVEGLRVISPTSVVALKGRRLTVRQVADTLHVQHVLDGSLQREGEHIQAKVQLIDARRGRVLWQQTYRLGEAQLLQLQDAIARQVTGALLTTAASESLPAAPRRTQHVAAYESYLKGLYWLERRTPEALRLARSAFQEALTQDPDYPQAMAGLASARTYSVVYGYRNEADPYNEVAEALRLADRAIARDSLAPEGWLARADARSIAFIEDDSVRADVDRARRLMPNSADIAMAYAWSLFRSGKMGLAIAAARRALALDPLAPGLRHSLVALAIGARRYDVALREVRPDLPGGAVDPVSAILQAYAQLLSGKAAECAGRDLGPWVAVRAMCLHQIGRTAEGAALADSLGRELDAERYRFLHQYADLAAYYAWRGDPARAEHWLERALAHSPMLHRWQLKSGLFDRVWSQGEFQTGFARARALADERLRARRAALGE